MFTKAFWSETLERALRAFAVGMIASMQVADKLAPGSGLDSKDKIIGSLVQAGASILISIAGSQVGAKDSPALLPADSDPPVGDN